VRRQGLEPRTRGLREDRLAALGALPALMAREPSESTIRTTIPQGSFQHRGDRRVERLLAAGGLDGALQVAGVPPPRHVTHNPISFSRSAR
jgi:hypothetical protein